MGKHWPWIVFGISVLISTIAIKQSLFYRWFGYETIPAPVTDEFDYAWQGISLRRYGIPLGWSMWSGEYMSDKYKSKGGSLDGFVISYGGKEIDLKQYLKDPTPYYAIKEVDYIKGKEHMFFAVPFFDHPPLGGLIYSLGVDNSVVQVDQVKAVAFRQPALVMAVVTAVLLFILLFLISNNPLMATLGVVIYSTVPTYLLATRTAFLENVVSPISLLQLIVLYLAIKKFQKNYLFILSGLICGISVLAKEPAISFIAASLILMIMSKVSRKNIILFLSSVALPILLYVAWGFWLQRDLFLGIFLANAGRGYFGAIKPVTVLEALKFKNFPTDGWWIWGIISFLMISYKARRKELLFITIPLTCHIILILLLGSPNYPWYFVSTIPLLAACSAIFTWRIIKSPTIASALAFFFIPFSSSYYWGRVALSLEPSINHYRYAFLIFALLLFARLKYSKSMIMKIIWFVFMIILLRKIVIFNQVFFPYLIAHWGNLPVPNLPTF